MYVMYGASASIPSIIRPRYPEPTAMLATERVVRTSDPSTQGVSVIQRSSQA